MKYLVKLTTPSLSERPIRGGISRSIVAVFLIVILATSCTSQYTAKELKIEYISHASFVITTDSTSILIDPFKSKHWIGYDFPENITADATFITHPHYDHDGGRFLGEKPYWETKTKIYETSGDFKVAPFSIKGTKGKHCDPYGKEFGQKNTIYSFELDGMRLVHLGDNGPLTEANYKTLGTIDILMIPIDSQYHILKQQEIEEIIKRLQPKLIIPMHYRIPHLEAENKPKDLGGIEPYLSKQAHVIRSKTNTYTITKNKLPEKATYLYLEVHPNLKN